MTDEMVHALANLLRIEVDHAFMAGLQNRIYNHTHEEAVNLIMNEIGEMLEAEDLE